MRYSAVLAAGIVAVASASAQGVGSAGPDPNAQAQADGCTRKTNELITQQAPEWVYVNDKDHPASGPPPPPQWAAGVLSPTDGISYYAVHPTPVDNPVTHDSYDVLQNILVDSVFDPLLAGDTTAGTGNFEGNDEETGRLHTELEQNAFPAFAWPEQGDRVQVLGSWVWDCGHWVPGGERTELHPFRALWVDRGVSPRNPYGETEGDLLVTTDKTPAGKQADCAHLTKGNSALFRACLAVDPNWQDTSGTYSFRLTAPPRPSPQAKLRAHVVNAGSSVGAPVPNVTVRARSARIQITIRATPGKRLVVADEVFLGWTPMPPSALPVHLRLSFQSLLVRRAMDPGCPNGASACGSVETTKGGQVTSPPGEWNLYADVAGIWIPWKPAVLFVRDGQTVKLGRKVDFYMQRGRAWRLFVFSRECDFGLLSASNPARPPAPCPKSSEFGDVSGDDSPGSVVDQYRSAPVSLGPHSSDSRLEGSSCPTVNRNGCYRLTYRVTRIADEASRSAR